MDTEQQGGPPRGRPMYTYEFAKADQPTFEPDREVQSFGMVELTMGEERIATRGVPLDMRLESLVQAALRKVNGSGVSTADGTADAWWKSLRPRQRSFMLAAYQKLNTTQDKEDAAFLSGAKVELG